MVCLVSALGALPLNPAAARLVAPPPEGRSADARPDTAKANFADYIWPTDASRSITSTFAEYRTSHFHGGIDISTHGHTGYKVFASRDGYVFRVRITPDGYGKMLFLRHPGGYVTTYAHLKGFNEEITRVVRREQYRKGTYAVDLTLDSAKIQVKKGDVVAYTGDTGVGPPHLHFEIRDEHLDPVNPMLCGEFATQDRLPPVIKRLLISPLDYSSTIDNNPASKIIRRFARRGRDLAVPQRLIVHGTIGLGVEAIDRTEGTWSRSGIHSLAFYLDDTLLFRKVLDLVPADDSKEIDLDYDLPMILQGWGKFQKLYIDAGNSLPLYGGRPEGSGVIRTELLREGVHGYRIVCGDSHGNTTTLGGTLIVNHRPSISVASVDEDGVTLGGQSLNLIQTCRVAGKKFAGSSWAEHTIRRGSFEADSTGIELPVNTKPYDLLRISAETELGSQTPPIYYVLHKPRDSGVRAPLLKTEILDDYVRFTVSAPGLFTSAPGLTVLEGSSGVRVPVQAAEPDRYSGAYAPSQDFEGRRTVTAHAEVNGRDAVATADFTVYPVPSTRSGSFTADPSGLRFSFDSAAVYRPLLLQVTSDSYDHSTVYVLDPQDRLLNRGIRVTVPADAARGGGHRALFFRSNGGWIYKTDRPDSGGGSFSTTLTRTLGELAVLADDEAPSFGRLRVSAPRGKPFVRFRYHDNLSGVDTDEIKVYIDDALVIPEIDAEHHEAVYQAENPLDRGKHSLKITMRDRMRNESQISRTFTVR
jgi:hypothetical protein